MVKHQKTLLRTDECSEAPWKAGCSCGWSSLAANEKVAGKLHTEHKAATKAHYKLSRLFAGRTLFVFAAPPKGGEWTYTPDPQQAAVVDEKTKIRYMRHLRECALKGSATLVAQL